MNVYCYYLSNDVYNLLHFENESQEPVRVEIRIADGYPATCYYYKSEPSELFKNF